MVGNELRVKEVMTPKPLSVKEGNFVTTARSLFRRYGYQSSLLVGDDRGETKFLGIIGREDVFRVYL